LEQAQKLARHGPPVKAKFAARIRDLYTELGRAFEQNGQPEQASAIYAELARLPPKSSG
jgi:hypothetical protein